MARSRNAKVFAVFDISSSSVAGAHILSEGTKAIMLASARADAPLQEDINVKRFVDDTVKHLESITGRIRKADVHHPTSIQVVLASPWYSSQTRTIVYKKETPFLCTEKLIKELIDTELKTILSNNEGSFGGESIVVEKQISGITINGYPTTNPYGKHGTLLELYLVVTIAPESVLKRFSDTLRRAYGTRSISYTTSPFSTFIALRDLGAAPDSTVVIDVGEEVTDVAFVKEGILLYQHSFPVGTYGLYRTLATKGKHTIAEAIATLEAYRLGKLSVRATKGVELAINEYGALWQSGFREVLDGGAYGFCMPSKCIITADARFESLLTTIIKADPFIQHSCSYQAVETMFVDDAIVGAAIRSVDTTKIDIPLATAALFAQRTL